MIITSIHLHLHLLLLLLLSLLPPSSPLNIDGTLLLSFKYSILTDPFSLLDDWDYNDATPCFWTGVACAAVVDSPGLPELFRVTTLALPNASFAGNIPEDLGLIPHLTTLDLSGNSFTGNLPRSLFNASRLRVIDLSGNAFSGSIPELSAGAAPSVTFLNFSNNKLLGNVPAVGFLPNLTVVSLRGNHLSGEIPAGIGSVRVFDVSSNLLNGSLPSGFGGGSLRYLNLSSNRIAGGVPAGFAARIPANATIDVSFNRLSGDIPASAALVNQKKEAFAGNADLCGRPVEKLCTVPSMLSSPPNVTAANASSSAAAIAAIPKTIGSPDSAAAGNPIAAQRHGLKPAAIAGIAVVPLAAVGVLCALILFIYQKRKNVAAATPAANTSEFRKNPDVRETRTLPIWPCLTITNAEETSEATVSDSDDDSRNNNNKVADHQNNAVIEKKKRERLLVMVDGETQLEVETLFKASAYVLGSSGAAIVYKAVLQDGTAFAVRRIGEGGGSVGKVKEFEQRFKAVAKLRHPNLVRLRGFYWGEDEKLVISDYVSNGSLANVGFSKLFLIITFFSSFAIFL